MPHTGAINLEREIAKCRAGLSVIAMVTVYLDPGVSQLGAVPPAAAPANDVYALGVIGLHFMYALSVLRGLQVSPTVRDRVVTASVYLDVLFGGAIAIVTEGATSPARVFFGFAVLAVACRSGFRATVVVTLASVAVYVGTTFLVPLSSQNAYTVRLRSFYMAITCYLIGYLAQQRWNVEAQKRANAMTAERHGIARSLHDGYVQALAGVSLRIEACRELLRRERSERALAELTDLQTGVQREYDEVRAYVRSLVDLDQRIEDAPKAPDVVLDVEASFRCDGATAEHVLLIMLEGVRNARQHSGAATASVRAQDGTAGLSITIRDDGVGFGAGTGTPWSIASRVAELGGAVEVDGAQPGAQLTIAIPTA